MSEKLEYADFLESGAYVKKLEETYNRYLDVRDKKLVEFMKENKRLHSIIKEVREYIEAHIKYECDDAFNGRQFYSYHLYDFDKKELLEILDEEKV